MSTLRRRAKPTPRVRLPEDCRAIVASWRQRAEDDVTEGEPAVRELEAAA